ncbi:Na+/H+ antiporter NhaC [Companilactobacillus sp. RD055328]|uniref:Na+/H+ antiporter NhaC n=1 Tax=Companilactobacillus sp. RD055328 TaxID=2916634 RepID=UPI001FC8B176|nr:Na+/H+ antiporter NhaC [Companilactobacillus sp. RD055328]GKQ42798.1 Na+/H+ antiporter NhaC [Companilactobacillus sp. RD055328]
MNNLKKEISLFESYIILISIFVILGISIIGLGLAPQVPILFSFMALMFYVKFRGFSWDEIFDGVIEGIKPGIIPIIIFMLIGVMVASWLFSGVIPSIMYYGFQIINVNFLIPTIFFVCGVVGIVVGSSFTTISTMGIVFIGMGNMMHINPALTVGAIVSGAFFGNEMSPLSDTSNLTTGITKVNLYEHLKNVAKVSIPSFIITMLLYIIFNPSLSGHGSSDNILKMSSDLNQAFSITPILLLPVLLLLIFAWFQLPSIPSLLLGSLTSLIIGMIHYHKFDIHYIGDLLMNGYESNSGIESVDTFIGGGGINSMMGSISLILCALTLGGLLIKVGVVHNIINSISKFVNNPAKLVTATSISGYLVNILVGEQYLSMILPGSMFEKEYEKQNIEPKYFSRILGTSGANVNALIPWGVSGVFIAGTLGVSTINYLPFAFYPLITPILNILVAIILNKKMISREGEND